jgi:hypothetical protein
MSSVPTRRRETSPETRDPFRQFADLQQRMSLPKAEESKHQQIAIKSAD